MSNVVVDGQSYPVVENLGLQGREHAKVLRTPDGNRTAVRKSGIWLWHTAQARVAPLREALARKQRGGDDGERDGG